MSPVEQPTASVPRPARLAAQLLRSLEAALGAVAAAVLAVLLAVVLTAVVLRYAFGTGFIGSEDLGIWLHVALIAVGAPLALNSALAMRFDGVVFRLPAHGRAFAAIGADVFTVLAGLILVMPLLGHASWRLYRKLTEGAT